MKKVTDFFIKIGNRFKKQSPTILTQQIIGSNISNENFEQKLLGVINEYTALESIKTVFRDFGKFGKNEPRYNLYEGFIKYVIEKESLLNDIQTYTTYDAKKILKILFEENQETIKNCILSSDSDISSLSLEKILNNLINTQRISSNLNILKGDNYNLANGLNFQDSELKGTYENSQGSSFSMNFNKIKGRISAGNFHFKLLKKVTKFSIYNFTVNEVHVDELKFENCNIDLGQEEDFKIGNVRIDKVIFDNFTNSSQRLELRNVYIEDLKIINSDLGRMIFNGVTIKKLTIDNVVLNDCIFNGVEFPKSLEEIKNVEGTTDYRKMKDIYRQLKFVMDQNGNITEANKFYEKEMRLYYVSLSWKKDFDKKLILFFQNYISYFGSDWIMPLLLILIFANFAMVAVYNNFSLDTLDLFLETLGRRIYEYNYSSFFSLFWSHRMEYGNNLVYYITPFSEIISSEEKVTFSKFFYNILILFLIYHFGVALKRTTKR